MYANYDYSIKAAFTLAMILFCGFSLAHAGNVLSEHKEIKGVACNASGECALDISDTAKQIVLACETPKVEVTWNRAKQNAFLIACDCECTSHDNVGWLVDEDMSTGKYRIGRLDLGKKYTVEELRRTVGDIPDIFQSHPLCGEPDNELLKKSFFVNLLKHPTSNESSPYCFSPLYITKDDGLLKFRGHNDGGESGVVQFRESDGPTIYAEILKLVDNIKY
ncbi:hypothetical protein ASE98_07695 [Pseudomonas sp. Leaf48]|uniref:hypothetical protein n=1 Tax=Pseudomonas sp. Leaf48 TaxID=1736221 RepID=UPI000723E617|nr:hypothetical protein [Pseudomonas sp. Leaf48]KQN44816.1 hypothetical protein ASE98_07695 [Pseudomonas sp. Leaf48]